MTKYAINERKQDKLNRLNSKISQVQYQSEQLQAIVNSLTQKNNDFLGFLAEAENNRNTASSNFNLVNQLIDGIQEMTRKTCVTTEQTLVTDNTIKATAKQVSILVDQLIYSTEIIDKLSQVINKKKAIRPVISNDLISIIDSASADANNAMALTLTALNNCYLAFITSTEADKVTQLECKQSIKLYSLISGDEQGEKQMLDALTKLEQADVQQDESGYASDESSSTLQEASNHFQQTVTNVVSFSTIDPNKETGEDKSLFYLLHQANEEAKAKHDAASKAGSKVQNELNQAQAQLARATVNLESLKAGLAAATAAAFAV
ncbi:MAG: hypothetical protein PHN45_12505 [Methylococcales bacterium]|nr:hypothetical protein [Methylococcales bacterium]